MPALCPHAVLPRGHAQVPALLHKAGCTGEVVTLACGCSAHVLHLTFETEQEDETKAPGEGKAGVEEGHFGAISVLNLISQGAVPLLRGFQC